MEHQFDIDEVQHALALLHRLESMRKAKTDCDLIIKVDGEPVHRNIVRANSDYIDAMLSHDTLENQTGVVEMKEVKFESVKKLVDFFYTGKISASEEKCEDLLYTASLMLVKPVCDKMTPFLESRLNVKSFFRIKKIATKFKLETLDKACDGLAQEKFDVITKENGFGELEMEYVSFLLTSCESSQITEDFKLEAVLLWIKTDEENRCQHLIPLMQDLDLEKVSPQYGMSLAQNERLCSESAECMKMLYLAGMKKFSRSIVENPSPNSIVMFDLTSKCLQAYNPTRQSWSRMHVLHEDFVKESRYTAVALSGYLYILMQSKRAFKLCISNRQSGWEAIPNMLFDHGPWLRATTLDDSIYVTSNYAIERYSSGNNTWEKIEKGICSCDQNELVGFDGSIYSFGGGSGASHVWKFSPASELWLMLKDMSILRVTPAAVGHGGKIFLAGGVGKNLVSSYDPLSDTWTEVASMKKTRNLFQLFVIDDKLYAVGHDKSPLTIEVYNPDENTWKIVVDKPSMKIMSQATVAIYIEEL